MQQEFTKGVDVVETSTGHWFTVMTQLGLSEDQRERMPDIRLAINQWSVLRDEYRRSHVRAMSFIKLHLMPPKLKSGEFLIEN